MIKSIWEELYYGKFSAWERRTIRTPENLNLNRKIENEKKYFIQKMSSDDCERFKNLDKLYLQSNEFEQIDAFTYGFKFGATIMSAVFIDNDVLYREK